MSNGMNSVKLFVTPQVALTVAREVSERARCDRLNLPRYMVCNLVHLLPFFAMSQAMNFAVAKPVIQAVSVIFL